MYISCFSHDGHFFVVLKLAILIRDLLLHLMFPCFLFHCVLDKETRRCDCKFNLSTDVNRGLQIMLIEDVRV